MRRPAVALLLLVAACGTEPAPPASPPVAGEVVFTTCPRAFASDDQTHLRPVAADADTPQEEAGRLVREHLLTTTLSDGRLALGSGPAGIDGGLEGVRLVDDGTPASVTALVLDHPQAGRRLAFLEVRLGEGAPVRWQEQPDLGFVTDGGDGGLLLGPSRAVDRAVDPDGTAAFRSAQAALFGNGDRDGDVCALRQADGDVDGVYFLAGYGDGGYVTFVGHDARDRVVSVVHTGDIVPWSRSGLPGETPAGEQ